jgi:hypothetical protein
MDACCQTTNFSLDREKMFIVHHSSIHIYHNSFFRPASASSNKRKEEEPQKKKNCYAPPPFLSSSSSLVSNPNKSGLVLQNASADDHMMVLLDKNGALNCFFSVKIQITIIVPDVFKEGVETSPSHHSIITSSLYSPLHLQQRPQQHQQYYCKPMSNIRRPIFLGQIKRQLSLGVVRLPKVFSPF